MATDTDGGRVGDIAIVDAHQHFWDLGANAYPWLRDEPAIPFRYGDYGTLRRSYLPADYRRDSARHNVVGSVHVEAESDPADPVAETRWLHAVAAAHGLPNGIVAQAWLDRGDAAEVLAAQAAFPLTRGVRHKPRASAAPDAAARGAPGSMDDPTWRDGYALLSRNGLSFDLQTPYWHLVAAAELARDFPETTLILNHAGLPVDRSAEGLAAWRAALEELAAEANTAIKISGLGQAGRPWTVASNGPVVLDAIRIFGADRAMFASNFPVDSLVADFDTVYDGFKAIAAGFSPGELQKLFHDNAVRYYRLEL